MKKTQVPLELHINIPQYMADQILKKDVGPYVFQEAQSSSLWLLAGLQGDVTWLVVREDRDRAQ